MAELTATRRIGGIASHIGGTPVTITANGITITIGNDTGACSSSAAQAPASSGPPAAPVAASVPTKLKSYTLAEVAKHNNEGDCWVVVNGQVLDATKFLPDHPGGKKAIVIYAGKDASEEFNMMHKPEVVEKYAPETIIGVLAK
jgi:cytochrome b involved in lipid metabolism